MVAITASLTSAIMAILFTNINAAPSILETRADERLAITLYKEGGAQKCFNPITDHPEFPAGVFRPGKGDVNEKCYTNVSFNSFAINYVQDPKRGKISRGIQQPGLLSRDSSRSFRLCRLHGITRRELVLSLLREKRWCLSMLDRTDKRRQRIGPATHRMVEFGQMNLERG